MHTIAKRRSFFFFLIITLFVPTGCKKLVTIDAPTNSITTAQVFSTDAQAISAMAGAYTLLINGPSTSSNSVYTGFASGLTTLMGARSSDELISYYGNDPYNMNKLTKTNAGYGIIIWNSAYKVIYAVNAVIEGIEASASGDFHENLRAELTAESKFLRAFCYFYLVNFFGDVPLALTVDFNQTVNLPRSPKDQVYQQIVQDLKEAQAVLAPDFNYGNGERIVANKWAATAMLARVYLYLGDYANAATQASMVIGNSAQYSLVDELNNVFLKNSNETIWQLQQTTKILSLGTATPEGANFIPYPNPHSNPPTNVLSPELLSGFEEGDLRKQAWLDSTDANAYGSGNGTFYCYPVKYKTAGYNKLPDGNAPTEYYMVLRLAEQYLIRAEAEAHGAEGGATAAIDDLNIIRHRAGLEGLPTDLGTDQLIAAIMHERQVELFAEWGHRWFDLIRMGLAHDVLSGNPLKQPWAGDYQFLYPIPTAEITNDHFLTQNEGY